MLTPFHLAIQVRDIPEARDFYGFKMGLTEGRSDTCWIDWETKEEVGFELYDHEKDPQENVNVAGENKEIVADAISGRQPF